MELPPRAYFLYMQNSTQTSFAAEVFRLYRGALAKPRAARLFPGFTSPLAFTITTT